MDQHLLAIGHFVPQVVADALQLHSPTVLFQTLIPQVLRLQLSLPLFSAMPLGLLLQPVLQLHT